MKRTMAFLHLAADHTDDRGVWGSPTGASASMQVFSACVSASDRTAATGTGEQFQVIDWHGYHSNHIGSTNVCAQSTRVPTSANDAPVPFRADSEFIATMFALGVATTTNAAQNGKVHHLHASTYAPVVVPLQAKIPHWQALYLDFPS